MNIPSENFVLGESNVCQEEIEGLLERFSGIPIHGTAVKGGAIWSDERISIFVMEGLSDSFRIYTAKNIPDNAYFFFTNPWVPYSRDQLKKQISFFKYVTKNRYDLSRVILLANDVDSLNLARELGLSNSIFCNQNAWLDFNLFKIIRGIDKKRFSMALNCRPESFKRPYLADGVKDLLIIQGLNYNKDNFYDLMRLNPKYINSSRITQTEVNDLLNQAFVGGIFSEAEGACFASSEYLLAGLPVISTQSRGGRDVWYTEHNSIICEPNKESVIEAVEIAIEKIKTKYFVPEEIRNEHIKKQLSFRGDFCELLQKIFDEEKINLNAYQIVTSYCNGGAFFKKYRYPKY